MKLLELIKYLKSKRKKNHLNKLGISDYIKVKLIKDGKVIKEMES